MENLTESMFYVLMALKHGDMCGTDIADFIDERTGGRIQIGPATLYTVLGKFEKEKYIRETSVEGRKRTYRITEKGSAAFESEMLRLRRCVEDGLAASETNELTGAETTPA